jgi:hypothetical protein
MPKKDPFYLIGKNFGLLRVDEIIGFHVSPCGVRSLKVFCTCICGTRKDFLASHLKSGHSKSCGCRPRDSKIKNGAQARKNDSQKTKEEKPYRITWYSMRQRCLNKNNKNFKNYGGRGISICKEWVDDFYQFYNDMGQKPSKEHSLDRINVNGPYSASNCRWATIAEQAQNKTTNKMFFVDGKRECLSKIASDRGLGYGMIKQRIQSGWDIDLAIKKPSQRARDG